MTVFVKQDKTRFVWLWLKNGNMVCIEEGHWPPCIYRLFNDDEAAKWWQEATGLSVTIETRVQTTAREQNEEN